MKRMVNQLVRDLVPSLIEQSGRTCEYKTLSDAEVIIALQDKLVKKAELFAQKPSEEEVSDIFELMDAIIDKFGFEQMHIDYLQLKNREAKGPYSKNYYLISVDDDK